MAVEGLTVDCCGVGLLDETEAVEVRLGKLSMLGPERAVKARYRTAGSGGNHLRLEGGFDSVPVPSGKRHLAVKQQAGGKSRVVPAGNLARPQVRGNACGLLLVGFFSFVVLEH